MSRSRNKRLQVLRDRAEFLKKRIDEAKRLGRDLSFDKAEMRALEWVLPIAEGHLHANAVLHEQLQAEKIEREGEEYGYR